MKTSCFFFCPSVPLCQSYMCVRASLCMCEFSHLCKSESQATMTRRFAVCLMTRSRCVLLHCNCSKVKHEPKLIVSCVAVQKFALTVNSPRSCTSVKQQFEARWRGADSAVCLHVLWRFERQGGVCVASNRIRDSNMLQISSRKAPKTAKESAVTRLLFCS